MKCKGCEKEARPREGVHGKKPLYCSPECYRKDWDDKGARYRLRVHGLSAEDFSAMMERQNGLCAICASPPRGGHPVLVVDHDHATNKVRSLLCSACNVMLGYSGDQASVLRAAAEYLEHNEEPT